MRNVAAAPDRPRQFRVVGFWRRCLAALLDCVVLAPLVLLFGGATSAITGRQLPRLGELGFGYVVQLVTDGGIAGVVALVIAAIVGLLYLLMFYTMSGQTPGMRLLHMRVIDAFGDAPSVPRALVRILGISLSLSLFGLGWLWVAFSREKRGLHDLIAGTWVVAAKPVSAPPPVRAVGAPTT